ncbi:hypothetical protein C8R44DRAFT_714111 [Mycena epipterygia]|nr:hypothetical protein C8R44DRAFT_714111 [Mycena epipterygia]
MSETTHSSKRKRMEPDPPENDPNAAPVRSKIWMPYGDIILQAESTLFRVNRDVLAKHSSVFSDMFSVPQPSNQPMVEGCPVVHVSDTAKDWELLLEVLYNSFKFATTLPSFAVVASLLRLGRKYDIPEVKQDALSRIHYEFPSDLETWTAIGDGDTKIECHVGIYVDLLNLAYECGIYSSIPTLALTCLQTHNLETLLTSVPRADGSCVNLPDATKLTLAIALERILVFQRESLAWMDGDAVIPHTSCASPVACTQEKMFLNHTVAWRVKDKIDLTYTIDGWDALWSDKLCDVCEEAAMDNYNTSREKGWELLPSFFGLPGWKDLKDLE